MYSVYYRSPLILNLVRDKLKFSVNQMSDNYSDTCYTDNAVITKL